MCDTGRGQFVTENVCVCIHFILESDTHCLPKTGHGTTLLHLCEDRLSRVKPYFFLNLVPWSHRVFALGDEMDGQGSWGHAQVSWVPWMLGLGVRKSFSLCLPNDYESLHSCVRQNLSMSIHIMRHRCESSDMDLPFDVLPRWRLK